MSKQPALFLSTPFKNPREVSDEENKLFQEIIRGLYLRLSYLIRKKKSPVRGGKKKKSTTDTMCVLLKLFLF